MKLHNKNLFVYSFAFYLIITFLSLDMYLPSLPSMALELGFSQDMAQYTLSAWFLGSASVQLVLAPIADYYGRRVVLLSGTIIFIIATAWCGMIDNYELILLSRFLQGATVCSAIIAGYATVHDTFTGKRAIQVMAILSTITVLSPAFGPLLGAFIVSIYSWRSIFFLLSILGFISLCCHFYIMPATKSHDAELGMKNILKGYKKILTNKRFMQLILVNFLLTSIFFMWIIETPFIVMTHLGQSAIYFGMIQMPVFAGFIVGGQITRVIINKLDSYQVIKLGLMTLSVGALFFILSAYFMLNIGFFLVGMTAISIGAAMTFGPFNRLTIESSNAPMGSRVAISSLATSLCGFFASIVVGLIDASTFFNIAILICGVIFLALLSYMTIVKD
jgi:Bcr/CflA subfamily drug resistance transporter